MVMYADEVETKEKEKLPEITKNNNKMTITYSLFTWLNAAFE